VRRLLALVAVLAGLTRVAAAQGVLIAPHAIYLDHRTRSGSLTLYNPGADPVEIAVSTFFGYPSTDSLGQFTIVTPDSVDASMPSAAGWIDAFPRRMTLAPLQRQTVRLLARPPQGLADGEYWSRVLISAKGGVVQVAQADSSGIAVGLNLEVRSILPLIYRKGQLQTGLALTALRATKEGDSLRVRVHMERQGGAAYVGTAKGVLLDQQGNQVSKFEQPIAIYYTAEPVFIIPLAGRITGRYRLRVELSTERTDIAPELLLRAPVTRDSIDLTLP
jgi:P pilus assembly chaperone PapD